MSVFGARVRQKLGFGTLALAISALANCGESRDSAPSLVDAGGATQDAGADRVANNGTGGVDPGATGGTGASGGTITGGGGCDGAEVLACPADAPAPAPDPLVAGGPRHAFSKLLTGTGKVEVKDAAVAPNGDLVVTGEFYGTTEFSAELSGEDVRPTAFFARFDPSGGVRWARHYQGIAGHCAVDSGGNVHVEGTFDGPVIELGGGPIQSAAFSTFFAKYDAAGEHVHSGALHSDRSIHAVVDLAVDRQGRALLVGFFMSNLRVTPDIAFEKEEYGSDGFVVALDAAGRPAWGKHIESELPGLSGNDDRVVATAFDGGEEPVISVMVGHPPGFNVGATTRRAVLVGYDSSGGVRWMRESPLPESELGPLVASGDGLLVGFSSRPGVAKITAAGDLAWMVDAGANREPFYEKTLLAATPEGGAVIAGSFLGSLTLGAKTVTSAGFSDLFLAAISPAGEVQWLQRHGGAGNESVVALGRQSDGSLWLSGRFSCAVDFGGGALVTRTPPSHRCVGFEYSWFGDSYLLRLMP